MRSRTLTAAQFSAASGVAYWRVLWGGGYAAARNQLRSELITAQVIEASSGEQPSGLTRRMDGMNGDVAALTCTKSEAPQTVVRGDLGGLTAGTLSLIHI